MMRNMLMVLLLSAPALAEAQRDSVKAHEAYLEGRVAIREKRIGDAINAFDRAVKLDDRRSEYYLWLGHAHTRDIAKANFMRQGLIARRIRSAYDKAVELDSSSVPAAESRFEFYMNAPGIAGGGMDRARAEAARLKRLHAQRGDIAFGRIEEHEKQLAPAEKLYRGVIQEYEEGRAPADSSAWAMALYRLGIVREKQQDRAGAKAQYDRALVIRPGHAEASAARKRVDQP